MVCNKYKCLSEWITTDKELADPTTVAEICDNPQLSACDNDSFTEFAKNKLTWIQLEAMYEYEAFLSCRSDCSLFGFVPYFKTYFKYAHRRAVARSNKAMCRGTSRWKDGGDFIDDACKWEGWVRLFNTKFALVALPTTVMANFINISILRKLFKNDAATTLYFHLGEIITDLLITFYFDIWRYNCNQNVINFYHHSLFTGNQWLVFVNQFFLLALLIDRCYGLQNPLVYGGLDQKRRAKLFTMGILIFSFLLYLPYMILYTFAMLLINFWRHQSKFWATWANRFDLMATAFYGVLPLILVIIQIVLSFLMMRFYKRFLGSDTGELKDASLIFKKEKEKKQLLVGTTVLNISTSLAGFLLVAFDNTAFWTALKLEKTEFWFSSLFLAIGPVMAFINGTGGMIFHLVGCEQYRVAFWTTTPGKLARKIYDFCKPNVGEKNSQKVVAAQFKQNNNDQNANDMFVEDVDNVDVRP